MRFAEDLYVVDGPLVRDFGVWFTTRMTVAKLSGGSIWVESPVPVSFEVLRRIAGMGPVKYLVAATPRHVWRLDGWHTLFPGAELWTAKPTRLTLKKGDLPVTGILGGAPERAWAEDFDQLAFKGNPLIEEVFFLHRKSHTVILGDLIQANPMLKGKRIRNALFRLEGVASPRGGVLLDFRSTLVHRKQAKQSLSELMSWDFDRLIIAHGPCIEENAKDYVAQVFRWLAR